MKTLLTRGITLSEKERIESREKIFAGEFLRLVVDRVILPDGRKATREIVLHPGAVAILPILPDGKVLLVRQHRSAIGKSLWEIPAGKLDQEGESPLDCAKRELWEETGYEAADWDEVFGFYTSPGFTDERIILFRAAGLTRVTDPLPGEISEQKAFALDEIADMLLKGEFEDAKTILALEWLQMNYR